jgi:putative transposase
MAEHQGQFRLSSMCRVLRIQRSGYYAWKAAPKSARTLADESLMADIRKSCARLVSPAARSELPA